MQGQHYYSIALGAILATGGVAMLMRGPHAAAGRDAASEQRDAAASAAKSEASTAVPTPAQR